jgi:hypothetical protein
LHGPHQVGVALALRFQPHDEQYLAATKALLGQPHHAKHVVHLLLSRLLFADADKALPGQ